MHLTRFSTSIFVWYPGKLTRQGIFFFFSWRLYCKVKQTKKNLQNISTPLSLTNYGFPIISFFLNFLQKILDYTAWYSDYAYRYPYKGKNVLNKGVIFSLGILTNKEN